MTFCHLACTPESMSFLEIKVGVSEKVEIFWIASKSGAQGELTAASLIGFNCGLMAEEMVNLDPVDPQVPISREWAAGCKRMKDTVLSWDFTAKLEQDVWSEAGFQVQLNNAYTFASSVTTTSDARGESFVTLTPSLAGRCQKKIAGPSFLAADVFLSHDWLNQLFKGFLDKSRSKSTLTLSITRILQFVHWLIRWYKVTIGGSIGWLALREQVYEPTCPRRFWILVCPFLNHRCLYHASANA